MKLYAVCVNAVLSIEGRAWPERMTPISKVAHLPKGRRGQFGYIPAVFTNRKKAEKWLETVRGFNARLAGRYVIIDFDSDLIDMEV